MKNKVLNKKTKQRQRRQRSQAPNIIRDACKRFAANAFAVFRSGYKWAQKHDFDYEEMRTAYQAWKNGGLIPRLMRRFLDHANALNLRTLPA